MMLILNYFTKNWHNIWMINMLKKIQVNWKEKSLLLIDFIQMSILEITSFIEPYYKNDINILSMPHFLTL